MTLRRCSKIAPGGLACLPGSFVGYTSVNTLTKEDALIIRAMSIATLALALAPLTAAAQCNGPKPAVTSVRLSGVSKGRYLNFYHVTATVINVGDEAQAGNLLQLLDVVQYGGRLDARGVPPLAPGQSYSITYVWPRSSDAGTLTSPLNFRIHSPDPPATANCNQARPSAGITV